MVTTRFVVLIFSIAMMVLGMGTVSGQPYPNRSVHVLAGGVGGSPDVVGRLVAPAISASLGQSLVIENRPPAVLAELVAKSSPDGYLSFITGSNAWILPLLQSTPYDLKDLAPVGTLTTASDVLIVHPSLPVKSIKDLIALAKAKPGAMNYASSSTGGSSHLQAELFKHLAGVNIVRVGYATSVGQTTGVMVGEVQMSFNGINSVASLMSAGKVKGLAVAGARRSVLLPDVPTIGESLPGFESSTTLIMFVQAKTPAPIITRLNQEFVRAINQADVKDKLKTVGLEVTTGTPETAAALIKADMTRMGKVIKDAGIKIE